MASPRPQLAPPGALPPCAVALRAAFRQRLALDRRLARVFDCWVAPQCSPHPLDWTQDDLVSVALRDILVAAPRRRVMLLYGGVGSGKTAFCQYLRRFCWGLLGRALGEEESRMALTPRQRNAAPYVPVYVDLGALPAHADAATLAQAVEASLRQEGLSADDVAALRAFARAQPVLFLLDGVDRVAEAPGFNLFSSLRLGGWNCCVVATCDSAFIHGRDTAFRARFTPSGDPRRRGELVEVSLMPWRLESQVREYARLVAHAKGHDGAEPLVRAFQRIPGAPALVRSPLIVALLAEILSRARPPPAKPAVPVLAGPGAEVVAAAAVAASAHFASAAAPAAPATSASRSSGGAASPVPPEPAASVDASEEAPHHPRLIHIESPRLLSERGLSREPSVASPSRQPSDVRASPPLSPIAPQSPRRASSEAGGGGPAPYSAASPQPSLRGARLLCPVLGCLPLTRATVLEMAEHEWLAHTPQLTRARAVALLVEAARALEAEGGARRQLSLPHAVSTALRDLLGASLPALLDDHLSPLHMEPSGALAFRHALFVDFITSARLQSAALVSNVAVRSEELNARVWSDRPDVVLLLADRVLQEGARRGKLVGLLWALVYGSRKHPRRWRETANAAMVLNAAGLSFSALDLRGTAFGPAPGDAAERKSDDSARSHELAHTPEPACVLNSAVIECADLRGANLCNVKLFGAALRGTRLQGCAIDGLDLGQLPALNLHTSAIVGLAWSHDGRSLLTGGRDKSTRLWNSRTAVCELLATQKAQVSAVAFAPDGHTFAVACHDFSVRLLSVDLRSQIAIWENLHRDLILAVNFSPDGHLLLTTSADRLAKLVLRAADATDPTSGALRSLVGHGSAVTYGAFNSESTIVVTASDDRSVRLWLAATGAPLRVLDGHEGCVNSACFSPDDELIASASADNTVRVWDAKTGEERAVCREHFNAAHSVSWSPAGALCVSGGADGRVVVFSASNGQAVRVFRGHTDWVTCVQWCADGLRIASGSNDRTVRVWDWEERSTDIRPVLRHRSAVRALAWSPDSRWVAFAAARSVTVWCTVTSRELWEFRGHHADVTAVAWSADGALVASGAADSCVRVWSIETGLPLLCLKGHASDVQAVRWLPVHDGGGRCALVSTSDDATARVWEWEADAVLSDAQGAGLVVDLALGEDEKGLPADSGEAHGVRVRVLRGHTAWVTACALAPSGEWLATASQDRTVRVWDTREWRPAGELGGHDDAVTAVDWAPAADRVLTGSLDRAVRVFGWRGGALLSVLRVHHDCVRAVAWHPRDAALIASGGDDESAVASSLPALSERCRYEGHLGSVAAMAFSPDGQLLATGSEDGGVRIFAADHRGELRVASAPDALSARGLLTDTDETTPVAILLRQLQREEEEVAKRRNSLVAKERAAPLLKNRGRRCVVQ
jgi:WD40 repeat protein